MRETRDSAETGAWVEHVSIIFDDADLARVRLMPRAEPIMEVQAGAHYRRLREHRLLGGWGQRTRTALGPAAGPVLRDLRSGAFQVFGLGMTPDPKRKVDIHGLLDAALSPDDPLGELLGPTRSCVLKACLDSDLLPQGWPAWSAYPNSAPASMPACSEPQG